MKLFTVDEYGVKNWNPLVIMFPAFIAYVIVTSLAGYCISVAEIGAVGSNVTSIGDGIWLAVMASSTVGFGDVYPVTTEGRFIVGGMFFVGMFLIGIIVGSVSTWVSGLFDTNVKNRVLRLQNAEIKQALDKLLREKKV
jgi:voltage-gated potassium channel